MSTSQCVCADSINSLTGTSIQDSNNVQSSTVLPTIIGITVAVVCCCLFVALAIVWTVKRKCRERHDNDVTSNNVNARYDVAPVPDSVDTAIKGNVYDQMPTNLSSASDYVEMQMQKPHFADRYCRF